MKRLRRRKVDSKEYTAYRSGRAALSPPIESIGGCSLLSTGFPCLLAFLLLSGCGAASKKAVSSLETSNDQLKREVEALEDDINSYMKIQVEGLTARVDALERGKDAPTAREDERTTKLDLRIVQLEDRIKELEKQMQQAIATGAPPSTVRSGGYDVKASYDAALQDRKDKKYERAIEKFKDILVLAPLSNLADNAQYWIGESYYALGDYTQALVSFQNVFKYQNTEKDDDAQLMIGYCYLRLEHKDKAIEEFSKMIEKFPNSEWVKKAKLILEKLQVSRR